MLTLLDWMQTCPVMHHVMYSELLLNCSTLLQNPRLRRESWRPKKVRSQACPHSKLSQLFSVLPIEAACLPEGACDILENDAISQLRQKDLERVILDAGG